MAKMWAGRTDGVLDKEADDFNSSLGFDKKMFRQDIFGSVAHAEMLAATGIIDANDRDAIVKGLEGIFEDIMNGKLEICSAEDIHMFVEAELIARIGDAGKKLHTARSRNDQVALDLRMYLRDECNEISSFILDLLKTISLKAEENIGAIMPGYTHLQRAQPILFSHHILAYAQMFKRDYGRIRDAVNRMNCSPLGSCALAGTTYPIDRKAVADKLGFSGVSENSIDGVSDRDFCVELLSAFSVLMMHLSRFSEEIILWTSWEFSFAELSDAFTTGSSIMPQKKNSDMAELIRGKTGRVYGDLMGMLTVLKGLPLAYNKDMQEDKEGVFDGTETVKKCLKVFIPMLASMKIHKEKMYSAAQKGFINATDLADYLTKKGMPFRAAYKTVGELVAKCVKENITLEDISLDYFKKVSNLIENDVYAEISLETCVNKRISEGGTSPQSVKIQIDSINRFIDDEKNIH